ncbi:Non-canonical purine NTP pyrophosphatase [uncultured archaeon]|nr:Non-canonical purine NTP pyrophosphatase [uncultured archaeon]
MFHTGRTKIFLVTANKHKMEEMSRIMSEYGFHLEQKALDIPEPDLGTIENVAEHKARHAYEHLQVPVITEDTGVFFDAYNDFPGLFAKRVYLGIGFEGLLALIKAKENRSARFRTAVCYFDGKMAKVFSGELKGTLLDRLVSVAKDRLPYEKIFVPEGHEKALVDLPIEEKNRISHRSEATRKLAEWLLKNQG